MIDRHQLQQQGIDQAEYRRVRADAERDREHRGNRKCGRPPQPSRTVADVGAHVVHESKPARLASLLFPAKGIAKLAPRLACCGRAIEAHGHEMVGPRVDVELELGVHVALHLAAAQKRTRERSPRRESRHTSSGTAASTIAIAPDSCCQYATSSFSRRRPAAVSL